MAEDVTKLTNAQLADKLRETSTNAAPFHGYVREALVRCLEAIPQFRSLLKKHQFLKNQQRSTSRPMR